MFCSMPNRRSFSCGALMSILVAVTGCSDDGPASPDGDGGEITLAEIWPAAVGNSWDYDVISKTYWTNDVIYDNLEDVPPPADWEDIYTALQSDSPGVLDHTSTGTYGYSFGDTVAAGPQEVAFSVVVEGDRSVFTLPQTEEIWKRSDNGVERHYEDSALQYVYAGSSLEPGYSFSYTMWEEFHYIVYAKLKVWARRSFVVGGQTYRNCVQTLMSLDIPPVQIVDEGGGVIGYAREEWYGETIFAPGIGIIYVRLRIRQPASISREWNTYIEDTVAHLEDCSLQGE